MIADGQVVGDGTWELKVLVTDLAVERCLRVKGDVHIGGVMLRLVEELGKTSFAQSNFLLCPPLAGPQNILKPGRQQPSPECHL